MNKKKSSDEEKVIAEKIIRKLKREIAGEYEFLQQSFYNLETEASDEISSICADYSKIYFNPAYVIERYKKKKKQLRESVLHCVLHCLFLHPSAKYEDEELFDAAADIQIQRVIETLSGGEGYDGALFKRHISNALGGEDLKTAAEIYAFAKDKKTSRKKLISVRENRRYDDHTFWRNKPKAEEEKKEGADALSAVAAEKEAQEGIWYGLMVSAAADSSALYGFTSGDGERKIEIKGKSKMDYKKYLRQFAESEVFCEDPETLDMMMYSYGMELYDDVPIVEFSEQREYGCSSDIIIAVDCSGSCCGDTAESFLRQLVKIFEDMCLAGRVNIHLVMFDTEIQFECKIKSRRDAEKLTENFHVCGFGGTDFECVFEYADKIDRKSGSKIKGLLFFSDAYGSFPAEKRRYKTIFFVPEDMDNFISPGMVPDWIEKVIYSDNTERYL